MSTYEGSVQKKNADSAYSNVAVELEKQAPNYGRAEEQIREAINGYQTSPTGSEAESLQKNIDTAQSQSILIKVLAHKVQSKDKDTPPHPEIQTLRAAIKSTFTTDEEAKPLTKKLAKSIAAAKKSYYHALNDYAIAYVAKIEEEQTGRLNFLFNLNGELIEYFGEDNHGIRETQILLAEAISDASFDKADKAKNKNSALACNLYQQAADYAKRSALGLKKIGKLNHRQHLSAVQALEACYLLMPNAEKKYNAAQALLDYVDTHQLQTSLKGLPDPNFYLELMDGVLNAHQALAARNGQAPILSAAQTIDTFAKCKGLSIPKATEATRLGDTSIAVLEAARSLRPEKPQRRKNPPAAASSNKLLPDIPLPLPNPIMMAAAAAAGGSSQSLAPPKSQAKRPRTPDEKSAQTRPAKQQATNERLPVPSQSPMPAAAAAASSSSHGVDKQRPWPKPRPRIRLRKKPAAPSSGPLCPTQPGTWARAAAPSMSPAPPRPSTAFVGGPEITQAARNAAQRARDARLGTHKRAHHEAVGSNDAQANPAKRRAAGRSFQVTNPAPQPPQAPPPLQTEGSTQAVLAILEALAPVLSPGAENRTPARQAVALASPEASKAVAPPQASPLPTKLNQIYQTVTKHLDRMAVKRSSMAQLFYALDRSINSALGNELPTQFMRCRLLQRAILFSNSQETTQGFRQTLNQLSLPGPSNGQLTKGRIARGEKAKYQTSARLLAAQPQEKEARKLIVDTLIETLKEVFNNIASHDENTRTRFCEALKTQISQRRGFETIDFPAEADDVVMRPAR